MIKKDLIELSRKLMQNGKKESSERILSVLISYGGEDPKSNLTYSYIVRQLRLNDKQDLAREFQEKFKESFDKAYLEGIDNPEEVALMDTINKVKINYEDL